MDKNEIKELISEEFTKDKIEISKEVKLEIAKAVAEAKLEVTEKRLNNTLLLGGLFFAIIGVALPLFITLFSANKVAALWV